MSSYALGLARRAARRGTHDRRVNWSALWDFRTGSLADVIGGVRPTVTRASTAWAVNNAGVLTAYQAGVPRIDYDPVTLQCKGMLIEELRTNICTSSTDPTAWTQAGVTQDGSVTAPDGSTVPIWRASALAEVHRLSKSGLAGGAPGNTDHAPQWFVYIPPGSDVTRIWMRARAAGNGQGVAAGVTGTEASAVFTFLLSAPFGASPPAAITSGAFVATQYAAGWWRLGYVSPLSTDPAAATTIDIGFSTAPTEATAGTANTRAAFWQMDLQAGSSVGTPISTTGAAVTRAADSVSLTGTNFTSWFNASAGTLLVEFTTGGDTAGQRFVSLNDGTSNNVLEIISSGAAVGPYGYINTAGVSQIGSAAGAQAANTTYKTALAYALNDAAFVRNGAVVVEDASVSLPVVDRAYVGGSNSAVGYVNGHIKRFAYCPIRLTNAQLQALTAA